MATAERHDPYRGYRFRVEIQGIDRGGFREASGLDSSQDAIDYREGTDSPTVHKLPGLIKHSNVTLKHGTTDDQSLWKWRKQIMDGKLERKNGSIVLYGEEGQEKVRWNFTDAWPSKYTAPSFNATGNEVAIETFELTVEGVVRA
jgi:phage tail-like protein